MKITLGDIVFGCSTDGGGCVASEETRTYTENSTYTITPTSGDCISKATVTVDVPSKEPVLQSKTLDITSNGSYSLAPDEGIDGLSNADITVNVPTTSPAAYVVPDGMSFGYSTLIPFDDFDFTQKTKFRYCWYYCSSLTEFPLLNTSRGTDFWFAWNGCSGLTSFPQLDLSSGTNFGYAWGSCSKLASFPALNLSNGTSFWYAWNGCKNLVNLGGFGAISADIDLSASTLLTAESIMNIINQAATVTGKTMKFGSDNLAKLTDEQKAVATSKGWTLA